MRRAAQAALLSPLLGSGCALFHHAPPLPPPAPAPVLMIVMMPDLEPIIPPPPLPPPEPVLPTPPVALSTPPAPARGSTSRPPAERERPAPAAPESNGPAPQLAVQLTPAQQAEYQRSTQAWLQAARHDLATLEREPLSGDAAATRSQAQAFVSQSQQALSEGDLVRASNLAQKAATLARSLLQPRM